jgi:hypothetical protein
MTASASASYEAPKPPRWRRALWWASDYFYAARRQAAILQAPWSIGRHRPAPPAWATGSDQLPEVILLPGVYEHWTFLRPLGDALSAAGYRVSVVHGLGINRRDIAETSERLQRTLANSAAPVAGRVLVAHSKGGLIGKHLLVTSGITDAAPFGLRGLVAVATPFGGARRARLLLDPSIRAFLPSNQTIVMLGRESAINAHIVSVFGVYDPHIPEGSALSGATNVQVPAFGHFHLLGSPRTHQAVIDGIAQLSAH